MSPKAAVAFVAEWTLLALVLIAFCREIVRHGPLRFELPETAVSNAEPPLPSIAPYLRFLESLRAILKSGDRLVIVNCDYDLGDSYAYEIAVSQLPRQTVVAVRSATALREQNDLTQVFAAYGCSASNLISKQSIRVPGGMLLSGSPR